MKRQNQAVGKIFLFITLLAACSVTSVSASAAQYSVVLSSRQGTANHWQPQASKLFKGYTVYVSQAIIKGKPWERLSLGFFKNRDDATAYALKLRTEYPGAWINQVSDDEIAASKFTTLFKTAEQAPMSNSVPAAPLPAAAPAPVSAPVADIPNVNTNKTSLSDKQLDDLMTRAKSEFTNGGYAQSIRLFSAVVSAGENQYSREALELLGLARHRNGQKAQAHAAYELYLSLYPTGEGTERVKQRLTGLLTETSVPKQKIKMATERSGFENETYGSVSQFYQRNDINTDSSGTVEAFSQLISFVDVTSITKYKNQEHRIQITADDTYDFLSDTDNNEYRYIEMYYDFSSTTTRSSARIGRQTMRVGSFINRFDGASAGYQITPDMRVTALAGRPVDATNKSGFDEHRSFYGATFETGTFLDNWEMTLFYIKQTVDGVDDLGSAGTEVQYHGDSLSVYGVVDYNSVFKEINLVHLNANMNFSGGRTAYLNAFTRKTPVLSTSNALIGQTVASIDELKQTFTTEQIYQMARDRTADSQSITIGGSQPLNEKIRINVDATVAQVDSTASSFGVTGTESTGTEFFLGSHLVIQGLFLKNDTSILGARLLNTKESDTLSMIANLRFPITNKWRIDPRFQLDFRKHSDGRNQTKLRSLFQTDYRLRKNVRFDFDIGYDAIGGDSGSESFNNSLFYNMGYRIDF